MKMLRLISIFSFVFIFAFANAQNQSFSVQLSTDTVLLGNTIKVSFVAENLQGEFEAPSLKNLDLVSGPMVSNSTQIINGNSKSKMEYTYVLKPSDIGEYTIPPAFLSKGNEHYETEPMDFICAPNPEGIIQESNEGSFQSIFPDFNFDFGFPEELKKEIPEIEEDDKKTKRKLKKI